jgi:hypothetical protein
MTPARGNAVLAAGVRLSSAREAWGDFLLSGTGGADIPAGRSAASDPSSATGWTLRWQAPSPGWCGYPITVIEDGPWTLRILGELYGAPGKAARELVLAIASGKKSPAELNGHLLLVGWNATERRWHVWTDRFGTVHAYVASNGARTSLGTHFPSVARAASRGRLDWEALAGFFAFGFFPEDRTYFDDVRILRPASHSIFDAEGRIVSSSRYWSWSHSPDERRSYADTVETFAATLDEVLDEQARGRLAIPISGGLDSRTTVASLTRPGRSHREAELWSYSYGYAAGSPETRIAGRVAAARGLPFRGLTVGPYLFDRLDRVLACVEGFQDVTQARQAVVSELLAREADAVVAAHWGDVWLGDMGLGSVPKPREAVTEHALAKISKRGRAWLLRNLVEPRRKDASERFLREIVASELGRFDAIEDPDFRVKAFKTEQWSFRWTLASIRMFQAGAFPRLPFYDTRMTDFFATVPTAFVTGRRLQIDYLKRFAPDLARVTWQAYGTNLYRVAHFDTWMLPARALKKAMRALSNKAVPERNWEVQLLGADGRRSLEHHLLAPGRKLHALVDPAEVRALLDAFFASPLEGGRGYTVSMLLTFAATLEGLEARA